MGLDISAYSNLKLVAALPDDGDSIDIYDHHDASQRGSIEPGTYTYESSDGFCAGSYSGYGSWRRSLAMLVGTTAEDVWEGKVPKAFGELINFSDCEGTLGPEVSAKLFIDFKNYADEAKEFATAHFSQSTLEKNYWLERYDQWQAAFELASNGGAVCFH